MSLVIKLGRRSTYAPARSGFTRIAPSRFHCRVKLVRSFHVLNRAFLQPRGSRRGRGFAESTAWRGAETTLRVTD